MLFLSSPTPTPASTKFTSRWSSFVKDPTLTTLTPSIAYNPPTPPAPGSKSRHTTPSSLSPIAHKHQARISPHPPDSPDGGGGSTANDSETLEVFTIIIHIFLSANAKESSRSHGDVSPGSSGACVTYGNVQVAINSEHVTHQLHPISLSPQTQLLTPALTPLSSFPLHVPAPQSF
ncbi:hypothetical protein GALMADRAFT_134090 [Galerina marginata CBS 339.88]|uniref:Uncharacterized protein n=1 Tax=Galerina marginata (strain CBS 339.88) TaxID=685588 RepID=A0A067TH19_GALM3|nr:hypothetical protein GALMADRAFT_134090 [Galerina marginata CBS 339.88]